MLTAKHDGHGPEEQGGVSTAGLWTGKRLVRKRGRRSRWCAFVLGFHFASGLVKNAPIRIFDPRFTASFAKLSDVSDRLVPDILKD
ncbi:hypothetical protein WN72_33360 [Bradyrhizobium arachidis]|uniref:Uncharacterized protein n=1 Tax=Bradyrhizobium arachidis TaxID=858423 RepID=A0AAE7NWA0_9BRAD|nr:hypothetical protein WN72_33360 [Bradyrhizobium arachidis]